MLRSRLSHQGGEPGVNPNSKGCGTVMRSAPFGLMASSRPLTREERDDFRIRYGYEPTEVPIAMDAVALYVNKANPIQGLTLEQVDAIFGTSHHRGLSDDISTWGQLGLKGEWERESIHLYGRDRQSGTRTFFSMMRKTAKSAGESVVQGTFRSLMAGAEYMLECPAGKSASDYVVEGVTH